MIRYFGYGSNIDQTSLAAKGVVPTESRLGRLVGWRLRFNVAHFFAHEGGMGNIEQTGDPRDFVLGMVHHCSDADLAALDKVEAYGLGYDRIEVPVCAAGRTETALAYVGLPDFIDETRQPTERYLNIILRGARAAGFEPSYVAALDELTRLALPDLPPFAPPFRPGVPWHQVEGSPTLTTLHDHVFDLSGLPPRLAFLRPWFCGQDITVFLLNRADCSDGSDTREDIRAGRISAAQQIYLNRNLHAFAQDYVYAGPLVRD